jgi:hypothetical protein
MRTRILAMVSALMLVAVSAKAGDWAGIGLWQGSIGTRQLSVCFNDDRLGAYFDRNSMRLIALVADRARPGVWKEEDGRGSGALWNVVPVNHDVLSARWSGIAFTLTRTGSSGCADPAFNAPRERLSAPQAGPLRTIDGRTWRPIAMKGPYIPEFEISTVELLDSTPGIVAINAELRRFLPATEAAVAEFFSCMHDQLGTYPQDGQSSVMLEPTLWTAALVSVRSIQSWSCGGAHPDFDRAFFLWNARTGEAIDVARWFKDDVVGRAGPGKSHPVGKALVQTIAGLPIRGDCREVIRASESFDIAPAHGGMTFTPSDLPRAMRACEDEILVPYDRLKPFLTVEGAAMIGLL